MTLKITLLLCGLIVTINALVSCVTSPKKRFQPSITSTTFGVVFFTNVKLCCHTNSLSMKNANTLELRNAWVCEVMDLPPLIVMGNKKQGVSSKDKGRPF